MSAPTNIPTDDLVNFSIKVNGAAISDTIQVMSIQVHAGVNQIPSASITLHDGGAGKEGFEVSSSNTFVPGNQLSIQAGYDGDSEIIFSGIVTKQSIKVQRNVGTVLEVICRDQAIKMAVGRKTATFAQQTDSEIIKSIVSNYSGLSVKITTTQTTWPEQVQYYVSDWDFVRSRAEVNGMVVTALNGEVAVFPPDKDTTSVMEIEYGNNLLEFNADLNSVNQLSSVTASSWDFKTQQITNGTASSNYKGAGNLSTKQLSEVIGLKDYDIQTTVPLGSSELTNWSKATLVKSEYAKIQGEVKFQGSSKVLPGKYLTLSKLGDRFNGDHFVSEITHLIADGNWTTQASLGLSDTWVTQETEVMAPPASGLLPGVQGLYNGTVKKIYEDPDNQYRILVDVPLFDSSGNGIWARLSNFYATSGAGAFFLPEEGDEVVVGFLNQDPRFPIILGSLYSSTKHKPFDGLNPNEKNSKKAIVSKKGMYVAFDDENVVFTINTPKKNQIIVSDQDQSITIKDENANIFVMSPNGIEMKSPKDITLEATQNLTLKGNTGVSIESSGGDVSIKGLNITNDANVVFSANGSAQAELKGGAQATIKAAMVMIN
jgi:Rhs element Vgr protein